MYLGLRDGVQMSLSIEVDLLLIHLVQRVVASGTLGVLRGFRALSQSTLGLAGGFGLCNCTSKSAVCQDVGVKVQILNNLLCQWFILHFR